MLLWPKRQTEIALMHTQVVRLTVMHTLVHPTLYAPQLTFRTRHPTQLDVTSQVHGRILKVTFQLVDARVAHATAACSLESRQVLVEPFAYVGDPQVHDCLEMLGQACDPFSFGDVLPGCMALPGCPKNREHVFAGHSLIAAATANEELVLSIWQNDWRVCIQILHDEVRVVASTSTS